MAHPMKQRATDSHNAKLRAMTTDYGAASGPANNILAPTNAAKGEGPEDDVGFGSDSGAPRARADRASRRPSPKVNPVATLKTGGRVRKRADGGDVSSIEEANRDQAMSNRARGGRAGKKGATHVNVIVAPQGGGAGAAPPPALPLGANPAAPPMPPPMPPAGAPPMMARPPMPMPPPPGAMPPGLMPPRARGGRVHADEAEDKELIHKTLKEEGLVRSDKARARGGRLPTQKHDMTAGAATGVGRLEKIGKKAHDAGRSQVV